jgi:hypothetical protein
MPSGYSPNGQYEDRRDDATSSRDTETELTTTYSRVGEATVPQNAEPTPQTEEQSKRQRRNPFQYVKEWPRPAKIGAIVGLAALAVPGGLYARHHSEDVKRDNMIAAESTKFAGGLMPDFLNCRDPKSALTLDMAADTASGLKLNIKFMNAKTGKEVLGYMPKEAHMVGRMAIGLCVAGDAAGNSKPKPLAQYVDGQIQVDRSVVKLASLEKLDIPPCDLVLAEGKPWSCAVALFPPSYPIVDGKELTAESGLTTTYKIINDAEKSRALSLAKVPEGANKTLTAEQRQALLVANVAMFKELIDNADKSCVSDFDAQLAKEVLPELKKKFNALPQNQQLKFVGSYGPIAQGLTDTKTISDVLNTKIATADGLEMHCSVSTGEPQTAAPSQPANSPPPTPSPTQTSQPKTTTNGAKP